MNESGDSPQVPSRHGRVSRALNVAQNRVLVPLPTWLPRWLVYALSISGIIVFTIAGFTGYPDSPPLFRTAMFYHPVALFLWGAVLLFALEVSIFEHPDEKGVVTVRPRHRPWCYLVTLVCVLVAFAAFLRPDVLNSLLSRFASSLHTDQGKLIFTAFNFYLIGMFWLDVMKRFVQRHKGSRSNGKETVYGNMFAASLLAALLALLLRADVINFLLRSLQVGGLGAHSIGAAHIDDCTVSWLTSNCAHVTDPRDLPTLTFLDLVQALVYLVLGGVMLGVAVANRIFTLRKANAPQSVIETPEMSSLTAPNAEVEGAFQELLSAIVRAVFALFRSLRNVLWPALILLATGATAAGAHYTQRYLHALSCEHQLAVYKNVAFCAHYSPLLFDSVWLNYQYIVSTLGWVLVAGFAAILSLVLLLFDWGKKETHIKDQLKLAMHVMWLWMRTLGTLAVAVLAPVLIFSVLVLWPLNFLVKIILGDRVVPLPFHPPGIITYVALLTFLVVFAIRRRYTRVPPADGESTRRRHQKRPDRKVAVQFTPRHDSRG